MTEDPMDALRAARDDAMTLDLPPVADLASGLCSACRRPTQRYGAALCARCAAAWRAARWFRRRREGE